jgi:hypothetical protein
MRCSQDRHGQRVQMREKDSNAMKVTDCAGSLIKIASQLV